VTLFNYPKSKHQCQLLPRQFKHYRADKRFLQAEFFRVCVYCRQPDSSAPNLNFGVDHYKPKGIPRFAKLDCTYDNLYYCCGSCNSRKNSYWPLDEKLGPYIVNPCDYEMTAHLRFDCRTGRVEPRSPHGKHTEELLHATVQYRIGTLRTVRLYSEEIEKLESLLKAVAVLLRNGKISLNDYNVEALSICQDIAEARYTMQAHTGELPLPPLKKQRMGVTLLSP
jgi:hypothetical protein